MKQKREGTAVKSAWRKWRIDADHSVSGLARRRMRSSDSRSRGVCHEHTLRLHGAWCKRFEMPHLL